MTRHENVAAGFIGDQVDVALAVSLFLVGQAVEFLRQRAQRFGEQPQVRHTYRQLARLGLEQRAFSAEDVAQVPVLERSL